MFNSIKTIKLWQVLVVVVVMVAGGGASYLAFTQLITNDGASDEDQQVIQVARGDLVQQVTTSGSLLYPNRYALGFQTQGTVGEVLVEEGQSVEEGQPLAILDAATLTTLETAVARARITLRDAQEGLDALLDRSTEIDDAQEQVDTVTTSLGDARRSLQLAQMQWETKLKDSGETLAATQDDYASPFRKYLNISLTEEQTGEDPESLLQSLGVDLVALFAPELRFKDVVQTSTSEEFPPDDPSTPWGEPVVYTWLNLFPGILMVTCNEALILPQAVCITNEMDDAWEAVQKSHDSLDTTELEATNALNKAQSTVNNAENALASAQEATEELQQGPDPLDLALAETEVSAAQAALDKTLQGVEFAVIRAPIAGVVSVVNVEAGQEVTRNTLVVEVVDPSVVEMDGVVDEIDILQVGEGAAALVTMDALPGSVIRGTVTSISDTANSQQGVVSYSIRIQIQNPGGIQLREGLSATANIVIQSEQNVLLVPVQALYGTFQEPTVRVVYEGGIEERSVTLGNSDDFWIVVVEGLSEGEEIVLESQASSGASNLNIFRQFGGGFTGGGRGGFGGGFGGASAAGVDSDHLQQLPSRGSSRPMIELRDVTKVYRMGDVEVPALRGVSLSIQEGEMVAIMGVSGSGKSTLMNIVGCLDVPTAGNYFLEGEDVGRLGDNRLAEIRNRKIGFVFQTYNLLPRLSALSNVELPLVYGKGRHRKRRSMEALERVGLGHRANHRPAELSGGEQQRVGIARALVKTPAILLADEPTGNLDSHSSEGIMAILQQLNREEGITVVIVTHEPDIAAHTQRVVSMLDGVVVSDEPVAAPRQAATLKPEKEGPSP